MGGSDAVWDDLQYSLCDVRWNEFKTAVAHNARPLILHSLDCMGNGAKVPGVNGGYLGDVHLELYLVCSPEQCVQRKVERGKLDESR